MVKMVKRVKMGTHFGADPEMVNKIGKMVENG